MSRNCLKKGKQSNFPLDNETRSAQFIYPIFPQSKIRVLIISLYMQSHETLSINIVKEKQLFKATPAGLFSY